ncbi:GspE/PulE family protein [Nitrosophilus kaiyonis]|uniref:GspE/PulE family protein n=1 Tax=Nitrosophilus kaiyonis TaxID=2930200 RepID=UPI00248F762D|nr:GspE/PulE family protein [Nitrosophilus kaiyonis]
MEKLTSLLLEKSIVPPETLNHIKNSTTTEKNLLHNLISKGIISENFVIKFFGDLIREGSLSIDDLEPLPNNLKEKVLKYIAKILNIEFIDLDSIDIDFRLASKVPLSQLKKYEAIPIKEEDINILVAFKDPLDMSAQESIQRLFPKKPIKVAISPVKQIERYLNKLELSESVKGLISEIRKEINAGNVNDARESSAILRLIQIVLQTAILSRASDIHIEPTEKNCIVRTRIDGILTEQFIFDKDIYPPLSSRIKLLSNLDIAEKRKPQDGRFSATIMKKEYDFRVSTLPIMTGESIVMRILDKSKAMIKLEDAGMSDYNYKKFVKSLKTPYGIILVTGPTGSGKTTTLYGALNMVRSIEKKIITVEDPIEYQMNLVQQSQVQPKIGYTFATALRSILRQDPDIIMIGEIRDQETLRIAVQAALTGHLVLSTLHTNDAISAITRMVDMGIEPYLVSGSLIAIEAQRLVRKICPYCKAPTTILPNIERDLKEYLPQNYQFYKGKGCKHCNMTGYLGREMVSEVLTVDDQLSSMIAREESKEKITNYAVEHGFINMLQDGINKALEGETTIEEVLRVTRLT